MKGRRKTVIVVGLLLVLLGIVWLASVPRTQQPAPGLAFVSFTNDLAGKRIATFSISNAAHRPVLFAPVLEVRAEDGKYERWAAGPPEMPATALAADALSPLVTRIPDSGTLWRLRVIWQPKPRKVDYEYANKLDSLLRFLRRSGPYPAGLVPSARTWHEIVVTPEPLQERGAEPTAPRNAPRTRDCARPGSTPTVAAVDSAVGRFLAVATHRCQW